MRSFTSSSVIAIATLVSYVNAHGYISQPKASYKPGSIYTTYNGLTSASVNKGFQGGIYNHEPVNNAKQFAQHWKATGYKSLRDMIDPISPGYGFSLDTAKPVNVRNYKEMWWQNDELKEGFLGSHHGPCEAWVDNKMVFHYDDCVANFPSFPAKIPTDFSVCKSNKCLFVFYWLAVHSPNWQIYKQCVPITNGGTGEVGNEASGFAPVAQHSEVGNEASAPPIAPQTPSTAMSPVMSGHGTSSCKRRTRVDVVKCLWEQLTEFVKSFLSLERKGNIVRVVVSANAAERDLVRIVKA
ncbi:uncharacterized protein PHALS_01460 [Plasmopara halstedii]|uniref:RxLR-like protein n=1 Tax=Plasmopara halstedii TaxID=4781 RepID=A0A0P1AUS2_PLAHL|nr:uncharacterized protein PHALS_01460 [Plasmopara halstedii]CEG45141.1 hypothetical protein PHALS_01460 [Plasmopara halstedii]|eukprot:XP_024581510.1 hypothetical protein PHALS_01460 [Plasmopara halstedii]